MEYYVVKFAEGFALGIARALRGLSKHTSEKKFDFSIKRFVGSLVLSGIVGAVAFTLFDQINFADEEGTTAFHEGLEQLFGIVATWYTTGAIEDRVLA